ncbi:MAG: MotA/TolQ/ExbB proton channel family protein [Xenococcaceae cyanobacterium]
MAKSLSSSTSLFKSRSKSAQRQELDVNTYIVIAIALVITAIVYLALLPFKSSYLGILLYERGFTQYLDIFFASIVIAIAVLKFGKIQQESKALGKNWLSQRLSVISLEEPNSEQVVNLQQSLAKEGSLIAGRCSRVINAYMQSGDRKSAAEFAMDDSSFYISASESSYSFPRVLIWAIPWLGFIGTVMGISDAVNGFSGLLKGAEQIDKIKEGIGAVTNGLAIAFDTTLLSLAMSILVMIPLVLVERRETKLLLAIDVFINDKLLPKLKEKSVGFDETKINLAIDRAIKTYLPSPQEIIRPVNDYAQQAAQALAESFLLEVNKVQNISNRLAEQIDIVNEATLMKVQDISFNLLEHMSKVKADATKDRQEFLTFFQQQNLTNLDIVKEIQETIEQSKVNNSSVSSSILAIASSLSLQTEQISKQLENASGALESRVVSLEQCINRFAELSQVQQNFPANTDPTQQVEQLKQIVSEMQSCFEQFRFAVENMNKPRRITLVEQDNVEG